MRSCGGAAALLGGLTLGAASALGGAESRGELWGAAGLVLDGGAWGAGAGLVLGALAVGAVWAAELLSGSRGLAACVRGLPLAGALCGAGAGAAGALAGALARLGPGAAAPALRGAVSGGVLGAAAGAQVAVTGALAIGGLMCAGALAAVRRVVKGGARVAPLMTVSVAGGAARLALSLAPGSTAMGAFVGAVLGSTGGAGVLGLLAAGGLGAWAGLGRGGASPAEATSPTRIGAAIAGALVGVGVAAAGAVGAGVPLDLGAALVAVSVGSAMAAVALRAGSAVCRSLAEVVEGLFVVISANTHRSHPESEAESLRAPPHFAPLE